MRYRCVIPMVMDQEAKEREKEQQKKEETEKEEKTLKSQNECINEAEINESKNRVYEHFKQMSQKNIQAEVQLKKKKKSDNIFLNLTRRQRKRKFDTGNESQRKNDANDFSTSTSHLNSETIHVSKKAKQKTLKVIEEQKLQESLAQVQSDNRNSVTIKSIR